MDMQQVTDLLSEAGCIYIFEALRYATEGVEGVDHTDHWPMPIKLRKIILIGKVLDDSKS